MNSIRSVQSVNFLFRRVDAEESRVRRLIEEISKISYLINKINCYKYYEYYDYSGLDVKVLGSAK